MWGVGVSSSSLGKGPAGGEWEGLGPYFSHHRILLRALNIIITSPVSEWMNEGVVNILSPKFHSAIIKSSEAESVSGKQGDEQAFPWRHSFVQAHWRNSSLNNHCADRSCLWILTPCWGVDSMSCSRSTGPFFMQTNELLIESLSQQSVTSLVH